MIEKGNEHGIPVLNLYDKQGINPNIANDKETYITNGVHFNDMGHKLIADCLMDFLREI